MCIFFSEYCTLEKEKRSGGGVTPSMYLMTHKLSDKTSTTIYSQVSKMTKLVLEIRT
jgi:hypothetical protein